MSPRAKSVLIIIATLLIGVVVGALLNARLAERRIERIASMRSERGFVRYMEHIVQPHDEEQRQALRDVLERAGQRMAEHQMRTRSEARALFDSTRAELAAVLTPEQLQRLDDRMESDRRQRWERRDGPPRGDRGPRGREHRHPDRYDASQDSAAFSD